ncbi:MAG: GNAT family N-acetyltransferase [Oscillospiraceae bacterium]
MTEYEIFKACFPQLDTDETTFRRLVFGEDVRVFGGEAGFITAQRNRITLLCVPPENRRKGVGSRLLAECEQYISSQGAARAVLGGSLIPGAADGSYGFFSSRGYTVGGEFCEMLLETAALPLHLRIPDNALFCRCTDNTDTLRRAVAQVDEEWVQYFTDKESVFCCYLDGKLASFCIIAEDESCLLSSAGAKVGSIGCVGTLPQFRRKGLGLSMVYAAARLLKEKGCDRIFIHHTHLDKWYGRLGAKTVLRFSPAHKELI